MSFGVGEEYRLTWLSRFLSSRLIYSLSWSLGFAYIRLAPLVMKDET